MVQSARWLLSPQARSLRIGLTCIAYALLQLGLFIALLALGVAALPADCVAFLLGAQAGFLLSERFVWHDRGSTGSETQLWRRWLAFHGMLAGPFGLNVAVLVIGRLALPAVLAATSGVILAAVAAALIQDAQTLG